MIEFVAFAISLMAISAIFALAAVSLKAEGFQFFPPPAGGSWQHRVLILLFRLFLYSLILLTVLIFDPSGTPFAFARYAAGGVLIVIGFGLALKITFDMGWRNAFGEQRGLHTTGWFARSRNPIYVASWIGMAGWALVANNARVTILLSAWFVMYLLAPRVEEPWLEKHYGEDYKTYKETVPRFL